jgi:hypothetical protein
MSYEYNSLGIKPSAMASYTMHRPSLYGSNTTPSRRRSEPKPFKTGIQALSLFDLRKLCFDKDPEAIEEYTRRTWSGEV